MVCWAITSKETGGQFILHRHTRSAFDYHGQIDRIVETQNGRVNKGGRDKHHWITMEWIYLEFDHFRKQKQNSILVMK